MLKHFLKNFAVILLSLSLANNCWAGIDFDGTDDYVIVSDNASLDMTNNLTISCWVNYATLTNAPQLVAKDDDGGNRRSYGLILWATTKRLAMSVFKAGDGETFLLDTTTTLNAGTWYHLCGTYQYVTDGTSVIILYVNGNQVKTVSTAVGPIQVTTTDLRIGIREYAGYAYPFDGVITEVAIWNVTLTAPEVALLASSRIKGIPLQIQLANLKLYLPMDDQETGTSADGDTVRDLSGNGNNGTGSDGANNTGLTWIGESILSYPPKIGNWQ